MYNWYYDPNHGFHMWGTAHLITIALALILVLALFIFQRLLSRYRQVIRITVGCLLITGRLSMDVWYLVNGQWTVTNSLPFQLCDICAIVCGIMLLTKSRQLFEITYFIALGGPIQAILTPDLNYGFPQFRFLQFFITHFLILISPLILCLFYQYSIHLKSLVKSFIVLNALALVMFFIDIWLDANYMLLRGKPNSASLLDFLGPYPYYILSLEGIAIIVYVILYLPFALKKHKNNEIAMKS